VHGRRAYLDVTLSLLNAVPALDRASAGAPSTCRACGAGLSRSFLDLGETPLANALLTDEQLRAGEDPCFPLHALVCDSCLLVQLAHTVSPERLFSDYVYFSSYSSSWVEHARAFVTVAADRLQLAGGSRVVEVASNDGYLLQHFAGTGVDVLGVEPAANVAEVARAKGIATDCEFCGLSYAESLVDRAGPADLVVANNVLAHVPDLHDVLAGVGVLLGAAGVASIEFPHLLELMRNLQFDTIYHEHFSYFSLHAILPILAGHDLQVFDVDRLATHGGSLRLWVAASSAPRPWDGAARLEAVLADERHGRLDQPCGYDGFAPTVDRLVDRFAEFLVVSGASGKRTAAYGAAAKGITFLNRAGIRSDDLLFVADRNPVKQGRYLPGSHLPVVDPARLDTARPDQVLILPWNLRAEIAAQLQGIRAWSGRFVTAVPDVEVWT